MVFTKSRTVVSPHRNSLLIRTVLKSPGRISRIVSTFDSPEKNSLHKNTLYIRTTFSGPKYIFSIELPLSKRTGFGM